MRSSGNGYSGITTGPDGNIWFTDHEQVGFVTPGRRGDGTWRHSIQFSYFLTSIVSGSNGNLWILSNLNLASVLELTTSGQLVNNFVLRTQALSRRGARWGRTVESGSRRPMPAISGEWIPMA